MQERSYGARSSHDDKSRKFAEQLRFWMQVTGYCQMGVGVLMCLSICNMFPGMVSLAVGYLAVQAGERIAIYVETEDPKALDDFLDSMRTKYLIQGLQAVMGVAMMLLYLLVFVCVVLMYAGLFVMIGLGGVASSF